MKKLYALLNAFIVLTSAAQAKGPDLVFVTPGLGEERCIENLKPVVEQFVHNGIGGDRLKILNDNTMEEIADFSLPENKIYKKPSPKLALKRNGKEAAKIKSFCSQPKSNEPSLNFPKAFRFGGNNRPSGESLDYLFIGAPKVIDPKAPHSAMHGGLVPGPGYLLASRADSIYGAKGEEKLLTNINVHLATGDDAWIISPTYKEMAAQFTAHSVTYRSGRFMTFTRDTKTALERIDNNAHNRLQYEPLSRTDYKLVMIDYSGSRPSGIDLFDRRLSFASLAKEAFTQKQNTIAIGIAWQCECDVDLIVTASADAPPLYYANKHTRDGRFLKDYRTRNAQHGYETVELENAQLDQLMIGLNLYGGAGMNQVIERGDIPNKNWIRIDPASVIRSQ